MSIRLPIASTLFLITFVIVPRPCVADEASALARAGTAAIEARRFGDALRAFNKAAAIEPDDASLCFGAGVAAFMLGQDAVAQARFECALAIDPKHRPSLTWLGDLHYRAGRLQEAIALYEDAPKDGELQRTLDTWRKEHERERTFHETRTAHFTAIFEAAGDEAIARLVLERLEIVHARIGSALGVRPARPIAVVLYTREQFGDVTQLAGWSAAAYDGRIRLPLRDALEEPGELDRVLSHEFVHAVVATLGGRNVPAWLNEGLATVLEPAGSAEAEAPLTTTSTRLPLSQLHRGFSSFSRRDAEIAYASSARAVRRLIERHGAPVVVGLLEDLGRGAPFRRAFERRLAMRYERFSALVNRE